MSDNDGRLTKRIDVRVDEQLHARIAEESIKADRTDGAYVRRVLRDHFAQIDAREEQVA